MCGRATASTSAAIASSPRPRRSTSSGTRSSPTSFSGGRARARIYWNHKFLEYPLQGMDVIKKLGPVDLSRRCVSYLWAAVKPKGREDTLRAVGDQPLRQAGSSTSSSSPTPRSCGASRRPRSAREWAAQRIKGLSFFAAAKAAFFGNKGNKIKSLISEFNYPRYGPGQMWEQMTRRHPRPRRRGPAERAGHPAADRRTAASSRSSPAGRRSTPSYVISSLPLRTTVGIAEPEAPGEVRDAARGLRYRDFLTVAARDRETRTCSPTTGSTSTTRRSRSDESRTSAPGARAWSPTTMTRRSAWSTSASRATSYGA